MKLNYEVSGEKRKALVSAISKELNTEVKYLGAPTFAYQIGEYHIDKKGLLTGPDNLDLEAYLEGLHSFKAVKREYDEPDTYESGISEMGATPSIEDLDEEVTKWADREMRRMKLENENVPDYSNRGQYGGDIIPEFEDLKMDEREELGLGRTQRESWDGENGMQETDNLIGEEADRLTVELPLEGFTEENFQNLKRLIASKSSLIKKAIGTDNLEIERTETTLRFPWFNLPLEGDEVPAYTQFIGALYTASKLQKRVTAKDKAVDNEKFAFRVFLIKLGFVGDEYKTARKILLRNLSGNAAFKNGRPTNNEETEVTKSEVDHE